MKISVIIPTFNREKFLSRAVESVLSQSYTEFELIIVDDGSTDNSYHEVKKYLKDSRVRYLYQSNQGVSSARNLGVFVSSGEWVSFLDSDDEWDSKKLEEQLSYINEHSEYSIIHCQENWFRNSKRVNLPKQYIKKGGDIFRDCLYLCAISPSTVMIKRDLFERLGGFSRDFIVCEDYELWLRICVEHRVGLVDKALVNKYAGHGDQLSVTTTAMDLYRVRALAQMLMSREFELNLKNEIISVLVKKCKILLNGFEKYGNFKNYEEVRDLLSRFES
ncbi:hypothetical protein BIY24_04910 [Halobacteriovorax marinus]|uniref:glycosyltransferase family 2 protein n=1 Tax=Halobacteriovorax marinus TaxID=97084 RepID=UPI000BC2F0BD|nr:glycosyltransferase [Halobacteriovorax marinus]ATH07299.1 hypothetical protein BIY24_04910 [Halobacteriovorax marinus]